MVERDDQIFERPKLDISNRNNDDHTDHHFASAGAGIILSSGSELVEQFVDTFQQMRLSVGEEASNRLVSEIVNDDYIHFKKYLQTLYSPWLFNQFLAFNMKQELKVRAHFYVFIYLLLVVVVVHRDKQTLYNVKVRRMVVMGLPPIECAPYYLQKYISHN
ncbi:hypothetical protein YC2023_037503 [Brassica napus]